MFLVLYRVNIPRPRKKRLDSLRFLHPGRSVLSVRFNTPIASFGGTDETVSKFLLSLVISKQDTLGKNNTAAVVEACTLTGYKVRWTVEGGRSQLREETMKRTGVKLCFSVHFL